MDYSQYLNLGLLGVGLLAISFILFYLGKLLNDKLTPYSIDRQLTTKDNTALAISISGYFLAMALILTGALAGPSKGFLIDAKEIIIYSVLGMILLNLARLINDKLILVGIDNRKEIIEDRNVGVGCCEAGSYIATGYIINGVLRGEETSSLISGTSLLISGIITTIIYFFLAQVVFLILVRIYQAITTFNVYQRLREDNAAVGIAFGGNMVVMGIFLGTAVGGAATNWKSDLLNFGLYILVGIIFLVLARLFTDRVLLPAAKLDDEINQDQNIGAAIIEATMAICVILLVTVCL